MAAVNFKITYVGHIIFILDGDNVGFLGRAVREGHAGNEVSENRPCREQYALKARHAGNTLCLGSSPKKTLGAAM